MEKNQFDMFFETSSKTGGGVEDMFMGCAEKIL